MKPIHHLDEVLEEAAEQGASDIHLSAGLPPVFRVAGRLVPSAFQWTTAETLDKLFQELLSEADWGALLALRRLEVKHQCQGWWYRIRLFVQREALHASIRTVPHPLPNRATLGLPHELETLTRRPGGLVLVVGGRGSGRTTTVACLVNIINEDRCEHILTMDRLIEHCHFHKRSMVSQQQFGRDTAGGLRPALQSAMHDDADVVVCGGLDDPEEFDLALDLALAETLVIGELTASDPVEGLRDLLQRHLQPPRLCRRLARGLAGMVGIRLVAGNGFLERVPHTQLWVSDAGQAELLAAGTPESLKFQCSPSPVRRKGG